jgi:hypothetical protein
MAELVLRLRVAEQILRAGHLSPGAVRRSKMKGGSEVEKRAAQVSFLISPEGRTREFTDIVRPTIGFQ